MELRLRIMLFCETLIEDETTLPGQTFIWGPCPGSMGSAREEIAWTQKLVGSAPYEAECNLSINVSVDLCAPQERFRIGQATRSLPTSNQ
jgi:hypothetical protein